MTLEAVTADREARVPEFRALLQPLRTLLKAQPFLGGEAPDYGDYCVFGSLMWLQRQPAAAAGRGGCGDAWRERLLDLHGGLARAAPCFGA